MIEWQNLDHQCALAVLAHTGKLKGNRHIDALIEFLDDEGWVVKSTRRNWYGMTDFGRRQLEVILNSLWPTYRADISAVIAEYGTITPRNLAASRKQDTTVRLGLQLPRVLNRKTFAAAILAHSKSTLTDEILAQYPEVHLMADYALVLRTNPGLVLVRDGLSYDCDLPMAFMDAVFVPERAVAQGLTIAGELPCAVVTIENPATFYDMVLPQGFLAVLMEGWNTTLAGQVLGALPPATPIIHFGDFDPNGIAIGVHVSELVGRPVHHFLPDFALDYVGTHALAFAEGSEGWSSGVAEQRNAGTPLMRELMQRNKWLEQESITLDPRLPEMLVTFYKSLPAE